VTETEWLTTRNPAALFNSLEEEASERKLRLFACACCRHTWQLLSEA
jgi:hypothetical protein